ncbi:MAG: hypothetical protein ISS45_07560 [Candidatus Omnitrophica bacterium]|nr:hypothetical protein [Candidatus Omnitrophota bacterium]
MDNELQGFFDNDGTPVNPDLVPKPSLCISCKHDSDPEQEALCNLNRMDQQGKSDFKCEAYKEK